MRNLDRLTLVYEDDPGPVGDLLDAERRVLRFGLEGSGMIHLDALTAPDAVPTPTETRVPVRLTEVKALAGKFADILAGETLPCLLGHAEGSTAILVNADGLARCGYNPADLRGKVRFGLARVGWQLR